MNSPVVRLVVRAKDEAPKIGRTLEQLAAQTAAGQAEVVVVDSGSSDGTVEIARSAGVRVIEIPPESFTYGHSLNVGCQDAKTPLLAALSAHAPPLDDEWLARLLAAFDDARVACACGFAKAPDGGQLSAPFLQDADHARAHPYWGYSNSAGAFRAHLWREYPFREDMPGTEDKEWAWHWLQRGMLVLVDPSLATDHSHRDDGPLETYRRARSEWEGFASFLELPPYGVRDLAHDWWAVQDGYSSHLRARVGWRRVAKLAGAWRGRNAA